MLRAPMHTATATPEDLDRDALFVRVRELESLLKNSEARCAKLQYKLEDLLRRMYGPICSIEHTSPNVLPAYMLRVRAKSSDCAAKTSICLGLTTHNIRGSIDPRSSFSAEARSCLRRSSSRYVG